MFKSADTLQSEPLLDSVVAGLSGLDDVFTAADRQMLTQVLALRAQLRFDLDRQPETAADLAWLFQLDQDYRFDNSVSPRLIQVWNQTRRDMAGRIRLPKKANAKVWVDGNRVDGVPVLAATPGSRELIIDIGSRRETTAVQVAANREVSVTLTPTANRFTQVFVHPPRILLLRFGGAMEVGDPFKGQTVFPLYGKNGSLTSEYTPLPIRSITAGQLGGAIRVSEYFTVGVTHMRTSSRFTDAFKASIPSPQVGGFARSGDGTTVALDRSQESLHIEFGLTGGQDKWEASFFAGPSIIKATQRLVSGVNVQEQFGNAQITSIRADTIETDRVKGFNLGFDVSYLFFKYVGFGGGIRYSRATTDVNFAGGTTSLLLGGTQVDIGARFRF